MNDDFIKKVLKCSKDKKTLIEKTKNVLKRPYMLEYKKKYGSGTRLVYDFVDYAIDKGYVYENDAMWSSLIKSFVNNKIDESGDDSEILELDANTRKVFDSCIKYISDRGLTIRHYEASRLLELINDSLTNNRKHKLNFFKFVVLVNMVEEGASFTNALNYFDEHYDDVCFQAKKEEMYSPPINYKKT